MDFSRYFDPIREHMPANCSADVQAVIAHVDEVFSGNNKTATSELKGLFGLGDLSYPDDVAGAREFIAFELDLEFLNEFDHQFSGIYSRGRVCNRLLVPTPPFSSSAMRWRSMAESLLPLLDGGWNTLYPLGGITSRL